MSLWELKILTGSISRIKKLQNSMCSGSAPAQGRTHTASKPRVPQGATLTPRHPSKPQALPCSHLALEEAILLLSWVSGEGQPLLCSVGGLERAPGFLTHLLLRREINTQRAAHTLVYSRGSWWRAVLGGLLTPFSSSGSLCYLCPPLCL